MTTPPTLTEAVVRAAGAALSRAEIHDDRITVDRNRIETWAASMQTYACDDPAIACRAADTHYSQPNAPAIKVGDLIAAYRKIRGEQAEREKGDAIAALPAPPAPDPQLGGLPIGAADGQPIWHAYEHAYNAIRHACPTCEAQPEESCVNAINGRTRKIPCTARVQAGITAGTDYCETCHRIPEPPSNDEDPYRRPFGR
ncbi:hypothetical protein C6V83_00065 [Gordonia iterans]|uniref:DNA-binding phage zinc finger domain-containing protein n=1 Tax=Gordonia iterans TaxID=1004901 RepID=A0A2S0KB35_9ACTN|nr:hypothetical protein [Gordonia iterans]AVL98911.1 hypothetical protein C6V83_00065 [Gordonia iterans]